MSSEHLQLWRGHLRWLRCEGLPWHRQSGSAAHLHEERQAHEQRSTRGQRTQPSLKGQRIRLSWSGQRTRLSTGRQRTCMRSARRTSSARASDGEGSAQTFEKAAHEALIERAGQRTCMRSARRTSSAAGGGGGAPGASDGCAAAAKRSSSVGKRPARRQACELTRECAVRRCQRAKPQLASRASASWSMRKNSGTASALAICTQRQSVCVAFLLGLSVASLLEL